MMIYIAGPMRGYDNHNYPAFCLAARILIETWKEYRFVTPVEINGNQEYDEADRGSRLAEDLRIVLNEVDAIVVLPGWEYSSGVTAEIAAAYAVGLKVYDFAHFLFYGPVSSAEIVMDDDDHDE